MQTRSRDTQQFDSTYLYTSSLRRCCCRCKERARIVRGNYSTRVHKNTKASVFLQNCVRYTKNILPFRRPGNKGHAPGVPSDVRNWKSHKDPMGLSRNIRDRVRVKAGSIGRKLRHQEEDRKMTTASLSLSVVSECASQILYEIRIAVRDKRSYRQKQRQTERQLLYLER